MSHLSAVSVLCIHHSADYTVKPKKFKISCHKHLVDSALGTRVAADPPLFKMMIGATVAGVSIPFFLLKWCNCLLCEGFLVTDTTDFSSECFANCIADKQHPHAHASPPLDAKTAVYQGK